MALAAHVELEGLDVVLVPGRNWSETNPETEWSTRSCLCDPPLQPNLDLERDASALGFFSSLVDSAMWSLWLSIAVTDVNIRAY